MQPLSIVYEIWAWVTGGEWHSRGDGRCLGGDFVSDPILFAARLNSYAIKIGFSEQERVGFG